MSFLVDLDADALGMDAEVRQVAPAQDRAHADDARFRAMFEEHFDRVCVALRRFCVPSREIEDAAQRVFVVAWNKLHRIEEGKERAFLLGTAWNIASHSKRTQQRRREVSEDEGPTDFVDSRLAVDEIVQEKRTRELLDKVLASMSEELRVVLVLHELEELTRDEIASTLGWRPGTVASRLERAREEFSRLSVRALRGGRP